LGCVGFDDSGKLSDKEKSAFAIILLLVAIVASVITGFHGLKKLITSCKEDGKEKLITYDVNRRSVNL
jgi:hypothetical protein